MASPDARPGAIDFAHPARADGRQGLNLVSGESASCEGILEIHKRSAVPSASSKACTAWSMDGILAYIERYLRATRKSLPSPGKRSKQTAQMSSDVSIPTSSLHLHTSAWEDATVVRCSGRLTAETSPHLKTEIKALLPNKRRLILDLSELGYMDSSGLGTLVGLYISAKSAKCELQLLNLSPRIRELFSMTNLLSVFETCGRNGMRLP